MKTAIPPNGVTARCVSRRIKINRSSDNRAVISRGTGLSVAFDSIPLLSQILGSNPTLNFGFQVKTGRHEGGWLWKCRAVDAGQWMPRQKMRPGSGHPLPPSGSFFNLANIQAHFQSGTEFCDVPG
jgi:hypothetical protein